MGNLNKLFSPRNWMKQIGMAGIATTVAAWWGENLDVPNGDLRAARLVWQAAKPETRSRPGRPGSGGPWYREDPGP